MPLAASLAAAPRGPRTCRRCKGVEPAVRFPGLARTLCEGCRLAARAARPLRLVSSTDAPARPARPANPGAAPLHLAWVRGLRCAASSPSCGAPVQAHHVRAANGGGMALKPADWWTVPLCGRHHGELHAAGARTFEARHGVDLRAMAQRLAAASPHLRQDNASGGIRPGGEAA